MTETYPQILCIPECIECFQTVHLSVAALLLSFTPTQGCRNESRARGADRSKRTPTALGQQMYPRNGGHPRHFLGNIMGYASHSHINDCLFQQILLAFSLYDLRCIIVTLENKSLHLKRALLLPLLLQLKGRRGACCLLPSSPACLRPPASAKFLSNSAGIFIAGQI